MNEIAVFDNPKFGEIRATEIDGEGWFCLADVCKPLGIQAKHCKERLKRDGGVFTDLTDGLGRPVKMLFINEGNLYRVIFQSRKPEAEQFTDWVTEEVLPSIRKTGGYIATQRPMSPAELLAAQANLLVQMEQKVTAVESHALALEEKVDNAVKVFSRPNVDHWKADMDAAIKDLCQTHSLSIPATKGRVYDELEQAAGCQINARLSRLRTRKRKAGATHKEAASLNKLDAIAADKHLKTIFEGVVRRWQAEYCDK